MSLDDTNGVTYAVELKLMEGLEQKGHQLYCDNYYTRPTLFSSLRALGFGACGTARGDRKRMPKTLAAVKLQKGEVITCDVEKGMLALKWRDKRQVTMLSTIHDDSMVQKHRQSRLSAGGTEDI